MTRKGRRGNGEGTISKVGDRYIARASIPGSGGLKRKAFSGKTRAEAHAKMTRFLSGLDGTTRGTLDADKITVSDFLWRWLEISAKHGITTNTYDGYEYIIRKHLAPAFARVKLEKLTTFHVEACKAELIDRGLAPSTVGRILTVLSTALNTAVRDDLIAKNPVKGIKKPKAKPPKLRALTEDQVASLIEVVRGTRHEALYFIACRLGLREGEICALKWENVTLDNTGAGSILICWSVSAHGGGVRRGTTKTGRERTITLAPDEVAILKRHHKLQAEEMLASRDWSDEGLVFPSTYGTVKHRTPLLRELAKHCEQAVIPKICFHDLRHTAATFMVKSGIPIRTVSDVLGHAYPVMTLQRYSHVLPSMQDEAAKRRGNYAF